MKKIQKGFTLIELLIVIAIIGILAGVILVSTNSARTKAKVASWKATVRSTQAPAVMCCSSGLPLSTTAGAAMCSGGESWPTAAAIGGGTGTTGTISISGTGNVNCSPTSSNFNYTITPAATDLLGQCASATCTETGCTYTNGGSGNCQ